MITKAIFPLIPVLLLSACAGSVPDLGPDDGQLQPCPASPNCVNSQAAESDTHYIAPLLYSGEQAPAHASLIAAINMTSGTTIVEETDNYIRASYRSALFGFVDDVEFYLSGQSNGTTLIHVRSASRLGYSDFGVNRKRVEAIRTKLVR